MKTSLTGTLWNKWNNFSVQKHKMNLTQWDVSLYGSSVANVLTNISVIVSVGYPVKGIL